MNIVGKNPHPIDVVMLSQTLLRFTESALRDPQNAFGSILTTAQSLVPLLDDKVSLGSSLVATRVASESRYAGDLLNLVLTTSFDVTDSSGASANIVGSIQLELRKEDFVSLVDDVCRIAKLAVDSDRSKASAPESPPTS